MLLKPINPCGSCLGLKWGNTGFVPADGSGRNGVLIVLEAAGEDEARCGKPVVGKAGQYLWSQLGRVNLERDDFRIHNVLSCRPPMNKLAGMSYERDVIEACAPLLDATIHAMKSQRGDKTLVILTLGKIAFKRIMGITDKHPMLKKDYYGYPHWVERYSAWCLSAPHPSYLMRGNNHEVPILLFAAKRAVEIATSGFIPDHPEYLLDPSSPIFESWVNDYMAYLTTNPNTVLSYDIETPYKRAKDEDDLTKDQDSIDDDFAIIRIGFAYRPGFGISIPCQPEYYPAIRRLFTSGAFMLGWNNFLYDDPRVRKVFGV